MKKYLFSIILVAFLISPTVSLAIECTRADETTYQNNLNLCYPEIQNLKIELGMNLNELIAWFYYFIVGISGLAAFFMLVWGGFTWLTSAGSPAKISEAKECINSAVLGLIIILASFLILKVINPELITLRLPGLP